MKPTPIPPPAAPSATAASHLPEPVFHDPRHHIKIFHGDCLHILAAIPPDTVDLIFADPPYFLSNDGITCHAGRMVSVNKGHWDRSRGPQLNHDFNLQWLAACQRLLKPNGAIWVSGTAIARKYMKCPGEVSTERSNMLRFRLLENGSLQVETETGWTTIRQFDMDGAGREADAHKLCAALNAVGEFGDGMD
ncbi:MAG: DNA methyltransferase [Candidatus Acidiferrales bacterium]